VGLKLLPTILKDEKQMNNLVLKHFAPFSTDSKPASKSAFFNIVIEVLKFFYFNGHTSTFIKL